MTNNIEQLLSQAFEGGIPDDQLRPSIEALANELIRARAEILRLKLQTTALEDLIMRERETACGADMAVAHMLSVLDEKSIGAIRRKSPLVLMSVPAYHALSNRFPGKLPRGRGRPKKWNDTVLQTVEAMRSAKESDQLLAERYLKATNPQGNRLWRTKEAGALADALSRKRCGAKLA